MGTSVTYSGGLGILAGDYLKQASDSNMNMVAVGLLYRYGYFKQKLSPQGEQISDFRPQKFTNLPVIPLRDKDDNWVMVIISLPGRKLYAKVWQVDVGRVPLYLMDTDIEENTPEDRLITHRLYGGDTEHRFRQELLLGVGGIRLLDIIGVHADIFHCNEGHAAFIGVERMRHLISRNKLSFSEAVEVVRATSLFTTHTPVPAGHDSFSEDIVRTYIPHYAKRLNVSWSTFMGLGRADEWDHESKFSMSVLAMKLSQEVNGVSKIHGRVTREMFAQLYEGYFPDELHIGYVTNGVHYPTWTAKRWKKIYEREFGTDFIEDQSNLSHWNRIHNVKDEEIWEVRNKLRKDFVDYLRKRLSKSMTERQENPYLIVKTMESLNDKAFTIGFARRFATYKRGNLLLRDPERLIKLLNKSEKPTQIIYAGKAHPNDEQGKEIIRQLIGEEKQHIVYLSQLRSKIK